MKAHATRRLSLVTKLAFCVALSLALLPRYSGATWYDEVPDEGADIIMMDLRWPWWPKGTYYANWNSGIASDQGKISFYAGFVSTLDTGPDEIPNPSEDAQSNYYPGNVWSWWGTNKEGLAPYYIDCAPTLAFKNITAGEGSAASLRARGGAWPFMTWKRWYTQVGRVWNPTDPDAQYAYCGRWIKDVENDDWHMVALIKLPFRADGFWGNKGFIEPLGSGSTPRPLDRRFGYYRKNGDWYSSNKIGINKRSHVVMEVMPEDGHEYHAIEYAQSPKHLPWGLKGAKILPGDQKIEKTARQPSEPTLDSPAVENVQAIQTTGQVLVSWDVPKTASPFFAYKIEVFDNPQCAGNPKATEHRRLPNARFASLDVNVPQATVRMTTADIFDQQTKPMIVQPKRVVPADVSPPARVLAPGLEYAVHKRQRGSGEPDTWSQLSELPKSKVIRQGITRGFESHHRIRGSEKTNFAVTYEGLIEIPRSGSYVFYTRIDGAYKLSIAGADVIVRDEQAGTTQHAGAIQLADGLHTISLTYLAGDPLARNFQIDWEGPGIEREPLPSSLLFFEDQDSSPSMDMKARAFGDGNGTIRVIVDPRGHELKKVSLYVGEYQFAVGTDKVLDYQGALPVGEQQFWVKIHYDDNRSIDLIGQSLEVTGPPVSPEWTVHNMGSDLAEGSLWQTGPDSFNFIGRGIHGVFKRMDGDFTVTAKIEAYTKFGVHKDAWVGVSTFENASESNWNWGKLYYLTQTSQSGMVTSADSGDLGGSRKSQYRIPDGYSWIRLVRQGTAFMAWVSKDGKSWTLAGTKHEVTNDELDAGLFIRVPPSESGAMYQASVSHFSVEPGVPTECQYPTPPTASNTGGERLTGVVIAPSDSDIVFVRSTKVGLGKSVDGGRTWRSINGNLGGVANAVRSVAIHPGNPDIMFRAAGRANNGNLESGLWRTNDGGSNWQQVDFPGDFDGHGPSALCGEVIDFDPTNPQRIFVGTESKGVFKSEDGGRTWQHMGREGNRITAVQVCRWKDGYVSATSCPDKWMELLGRGKPTVTTSAVDSLGFSIRTDRNSVDAYHTFPHMGIYNVGFSRMMRHGQNYRYATSHGLLHNYGHRVWGFPTFKNIEWMRPITAIHGTNIPRGNNGLMLTQALDPEQPGRVSFSTKSWGRLYNWLEIEGDVPKGGLIALDGDLQEGDTWYFVFTDGLYASNDEGKTLCKLLTSAGSPVN